MDSNSLKLEGNKSFSKGEYKKAAKLYRDAIKLSPDNPVLYSNRAICFIKLLDWERALKDCNQGLQLECDNSTRVKLLYRRGLVGKGTFDTELAYESFNEALSLDKTNRAILNEIKHISSENPNKKKKYDIGGPITIPIIETASLPEYYQNIRDSGNITTEKRDRAKSSTKVTEAIAEEVHSDSSIFDSEPSVPNPNECFSEKPTMHYLSALRNIEPKRLSSAYKYILSIEPLEYNEMFSYAGIEPEFLEFYIDALIYALKGNMATDGYSRILNHLNVFENSKRFEIAIHLIPKSKVEALNMQIENLDTDLGAEFKKHSILSTY